MLRALALLNSCADGCAEALMLAHGLTEQAPAGLTTSQSTASALSDARDRCHTNADCGSPPNEPACPAARIDQRAIGVRLRPIGQDHGAHDHPVELAPADHAFLHVLVVPGVAFCKHATGARE